MTGFFDFGRTGGAVNQFNFRFFLSAISLGATLSYVAPASVSAANSCDAAASEEINTLYIVGRSGAHLIGEIEFVVPVEGGESYSQPRGPKVIVAFKDIPTQFGDLLKERGHEFHNGQAYIWRIASGTRVTLETFDEITYVCDFDETLSDDDLDELFRPKNR
jgi:hypothetical protein